MSDFAETVAKFAVTTKAKMDQQVREITFQLFSDVIRMSPVGNPELWASNAHNVTLRNTYTAFAESFNEQGGGRRISTSRAALDRKFGKLAKPRGYVGGRFRGSWQTSVSAPITTDIDRVDPSGAAATADVLANMGGAGKVTFMSNNLPYGNRLEFEGWSKQAPAGMVRIAMARIDSYVAELK